MLYNIYNKNFKINAKLYIVVFVVFVIIIIIIIIIIFKNSYY